MNVVRTYDSVFLNSKAVFIEYNDVIRSPFLLLLKSLINNDEFQKLFDVEELLKMNDSELFFFYISRKEPNLLMNINIRNGIFENVFNSNIDLFLEWVNNFMYNEINTFSEFIENSNTLNFVEVLQKLIKTKLIRNNIYVYSEIKSDNIQSDLIQLFGNNINYVYGKLDEVIMENKIPNDSTYVFSNIRNIEVLNNINKLHLSSILIADKYGYNYTDDYENPIIDLENLYKTNVFKLSFFNNNL